MSSHTHINFPKITKIHLQNFQAIAGPTDINLGDITFLIGPNSVGKSAVHDAIKFFQHVLEKGYGDRYNLEDMARRYDRSKLDEDESPLCCVGIEIEFDKSAVYQILNRLGYEGIGPGSIYEKALHECLDRSGDGGRVELRLTFNKNTINKYYDDLSQEISNDQRLQEQLEIKKNTTKLEVRIDGREEPFLVIGEQDNYNFFDYLCLYLPDDYVELISNIGNISMDEMDQYLGQYAKLHKSMPNSWSPDEMINELLGDGPRKKPRWFFSESICQVDLKQKIGKILTKLTQASLQNKSLLENHVLSESNGILIHRGVYCDLGIKNRDQIISFENNGWIKPFSQDLLELAQSSSKSPQISPEKMSDIAIRSEEHVKILNEFLGRLIDLFLSALHISHVPADRPIIDSHESVNLKDEFDWYGKNIHSLAPKDFIISNYPKYPGGFQSKIVNQRDSFSFKGYEYAIAEYAWRTICKDSKEKYTDLPEEYIWYFQLPKRWEDFPNEAIKKYLPSLSRYRIKQECHKVVPYLMDKEASTSGSNLTRFRVYDSELERTYDFSDLGSGLSFIFPILVVLGESDMSFIEQPELHLHPKAQAEIGDVLLAARAENRRSIIETHSEQMIMQISERIRETVPLSEHIQPIKQALFVEANTIKIHYFELGKNPNDGTQVRELNFASDGSLVDHWPKGFFSEGDIDTFGRLDLFSSKNTAELESVRQQYPWIDRLESNPDVFECFLFAARSKKNDRDYRMLFPIFASKIAEILILNKLIEPFKKNLKSEDKKIYISDKTRWEQYDPDTLIKKFIFRDKPMTLGQWAKFLCDSNINKNIKKFKIFKDFRNYLEGIPEKERAMWSDKNFIEQLKNLSVARNKSGHTSIAELSEVEDIRHLLISDEEGPGILLRAFGFFPEFHGR